MEPATQATGETRRLTGRVIRKRCLSKKLVFMDLETEDGVVEVLFKAGILLTVDEVLYVRNTVKNGDIIAVDAVMGQFSEHQEGYSCVRMEMIRRWSDDNPDAPFQPVFESVRRRSKFESVPADTRPEKQEHINGDVVVEKETGNSSDEDTEISIENVCKFWLNSSGCTRRNCAFRHPPESQLVEIRKEWIRRRLEARRERSTISDDPIDHHDKKSHHKRAVVFCDWLVQTFGLDYLNSGSGVIDVAGGRGDVSFELFNKRGIKCTLIDPRPLRLRKMQFKYLKEAASKELTPQVQTLLDDSLLNNPDYSSLFQNCSILLGMHPDQATEPIVDAAIRFEKPFAILPCCVFAKEFPHRYLPSGKPVILYDEFVDYLLLKTDGVQKTFLDFIGRNQVLFRLPSTKAGE